MMLKKFTQLLILGTALIAGHAKADDCGIALLQNQFRNLLSEKNELLKEGLQKSAP